MQVAIQTFLLYIQTKIKRKRTLMATYADSSSLANSSKALPTNNVDNCKNNLNVTIKNLPVYSPEQKGDVAEYYLNSNVTQKDIAQQLDVSVPTISNWVAKYKTVHPRKCKNS